ncbi:TetR/AcrR family transcriptional regulator [Granulicella mallensis]|nr:TetR/AcrR family transcriptional regulator [Granulicella mallensis]
MMMVIIDMLTLTMMTVIIVKRAICFSRGADHMRLTGEQAKQNRQLILETASRMFKLHGMEDVSVADIMKQSGFTHGGFYNHFNSKEELAAEAVACAFENSAQRLSEKFASAGSPRKGFEKVIAEYLSPAYRDSSTGGCPAAALPADAARNGKEVQTAFADGIESYLDIFAAGMDGNKQEARQQAVALLSSLVGSLMLSRAVKKSNPKLSDELLSSARKQLCK